MPARVKHDGGVGFRGAERLGKGFKVEGPGFIVGDLLDGESEVLEEPLMIGPVRVCDVDGVDGVVDFPKGKPGEKEGTCAGKSLTGCNLRPR